MKSHLDYYTFQAEARGVRSVEDVRRMAAEQAFLYRIAVPWLPASKSAVIADIGCGHGSYLLWLRGLGYTQVIGVDAAETQVRYAREGGARVELGDGITWLESQSEGSLDTVVGVDLIEHLSKDDFMRFLAASHRALRSGGNVVLRYPNGDSPFVGLNLFNDITHVWTYTTNCLESVGRMHGFVRFAFEDESVAGFRDRRWLKVPIARFSQLILRSLLQAASKEKVRYWNSSIWASLWRG